MRPLNFGQPIGTDMESRVSWITEALRQIESGSRVVGPELEGFLPTSAVSAYILTLLDDANAAAAQTTLGISTFVKTLLDDASAAAVLTTLGITYGTYTPTLTNTTNIDSTTASICYYLRIGNLVIVFGTVTIDPTAAAFTEIMISLPIASSLTSISQVGGVGSAGATESARIVANAVDDTAQMDWNTTSTASRRWGFVFGYEVL